MKILYLWFIVKIYIIILYNMAYRNIKNNYYIINFNLICLYISIMSNIIIINIFIFKRNF